MILLLSCLSSQSTPQSPEERIYAAGSTESEQERYTLLAALLDDLQADDPLHAELTSLLPIVDQWACGRERYWEPGDQASSGEGGYLGGFFSFQIWPEGVGEVWPEEVDGGSPLRPIWALYRGRMLIWNAIQHGLLVEDFYADGRALLAEAEAAYPDNRVIGMYLDTPIPWDLSLPEAEAPAWASDQREALHRLDAIISFWLQRQAPDGQLGGGWGDDVEAWRKWTPILLGFETEHDVGLANLAEGLWALPRMEGGYTDILTDVEHSAEDSSDTLTAMLLLQPEEEIWVERTAAIAELASSLWMAENERGLWQFQSTWFTASAVSSNEAYACDTAYHTRALQPVLLRWQQTDDPELAALITPWMQSWVDAAAREERGKPAGILPGAVHFPSGDVGGPSERWWEPGCSLNADAYDWPSAMSMLSQALLLTATLTEDESYLEPLRSMAEHRRDWLAGTLSDGAEGELAWAAGELSFLSDVLARHAVLSGSDEFHDLLEAEGDALVQYRLFGEDAAIDDAMARAADSLGVNQEAFTTEVRFSDRIFKFHSRYANDHTSEEIPSFDVDLMYSLITGDMGSPLYFPSPAVRWQTSPRDIAVRVVSVSPEQLTAELVHFGDDERTMGAEMLRWSAGSWSLDCSGESGTLAAGVRFTLPPETVCTLAVTAQ